MGENLLKTGPKKCFWTKNTVFNKIFDLFFLLVFSLLKNLHQLFGEILLNFSVTRVSEAFPQMLMNEL